MCPAGTVDPVSCPAGKYNPTTAAVDSSACISCPVGQFCADINPSDPTLPTGDCMAGFFCTGASTETQNTAAGYYSGVGASA